ncbi:MAG TPA: hypothetical protein VFA62_03840, partial [Acidimicrobiia bacterium]|nr:hypothetical protein [Acidimicrobiia bacterium]
AAVARAVTSVNDSAGAPRLQPNPTRKTIVDATPTNLFDVAVPTSGYAGGSFSYHVRGTNGTDFYSLVGMVTYACINKAGSSTGTITEVAGNQAKITSAAATLTLAWTITAGTGKMTVAVQPTGSLTETAPYDILYTVTPLAGLVTFL